MRRRSHGEADEIGWISTCDLLLIALAAVMLLLLLAAGQSAESSREASIGDSKIAQLEAEADRLRNEIGMWTVSANKLEVELGRIRDVHRSLGFSGEATEEQLKSLKESIADAERARATAEQESRAAKQQAAQAMLDYDTASEDARLSERERQAAVDEHARQERELLEQLGDLKMQVEDLRIRADDERRIAEVAKRDAQAARQEAEATLKVAEGLVDTDKRMRQELLGLPGAFRRVAFVIDRSQSMKEGGRWEDAKRTIAAWIKHLPVEEMALIVFDSGVTVVTDSIVANTGNKNSGANLVPSTSENRELLLAALNDMEPRGLTQTYRALQAAMKFPALDAIVLFTDGAPDSPRDNGSSDPREQVLRLVSEWKAMNPDSRLHAVGIGDYFKPSMRDFLLGIARSGDGAFIGR